jgi:hypothetical protein
VKRIFFYHYSSHFTMAPLNLKRERQHWLTPSKLILIILSIAIFLSSLSLYHAVTYSECGSDDFVHNDDATATTLLQLFISSPAAVLTSLASRQSYGLFNDIPDQRWHLMRERAHRDHTYVPKDPSSTPKIRHDNPIIEYLSNVEVRQ